MRISMIEWTHATFNPYWGCTKVSEGCRFCYAESMAKRYGHRVWGKDSDYRLLSDNHWRQPILWNRAAIKAGERHRVFCASMADVFDADAPAQERQRLWDIIRQTPALDWLVLTKRPENIAGMLPADWGVGYPNVWLGTTVEDDRVASRIDDLRAVPAFLRFLSVEPLIAPLTASLSGIDWVIVGGESGPSARPMDLSWARTVRENAHEVGAAYFLKQLGGRRDKRGKEKALLDGRLWHEMPGKSTSVAALAVSAA